MWPFARRLEVIVKVSVKVSQMPKKLKSLIFEFRLFLTFD